MAAFCFSLPDSRFAALAAIDFTDNVYRVFNGICIQKISGLTDWRRIEFRLFSIDFSEDIERRVF